MMGRYRIFLVLLCLIYLASSTNLLPRTKKTLREILKRRVLLPSFKSSTLEKLYGPSVTVRNFNPGEMFLLLVNHVPSSRHIILEYSRFPDSEPHQISNLPLDHLKPVIESSSSIATNNLILIKGDPLSGKTRLLRIIESSRYETSHSPYLPIYVDLPSLLTSERLKKNILTMDRIIEGSVHHDFIGFLKNIIDVNPSKIKFLFDGIDQVPSAQEKIISIISELHVKRVSIIMTTCTEIELINKMQPKTFTLPSTLSRKEFTDFTTLYWTKKLENEHDIVLSDVELKTYSRALQMLIEETPLPRVIGVIQKLAEYSSIKKALAPFPSVQEYLADSDKYSLPKTIIKISNNMFFRKITFYGKIFKDQVYGPQALTMMINPKSSLIDAELKESLTESTNILHENPTDSYKFFKYQNGRPIDFVHEEYKRYFAAMYILYRITTNQPVNALFEEVIKNPAYIFILEYIDSALNEPKYAHQVKTQLSNKIASSSTDFVHGVLDHFIEHRFHALSSTMFAILGEQSLRDYLNAPITLQSKNKYSFGMLSEVRDVDTSEYLPRKTPWMPCSGTRVEMIVNLGMDETTATAKRLGYVIDPSIELIYAAKQDYQYLRRLLRRIHYQQDFPVAVLNRAMYESLRTLGKDSIQIMRKLRALGADAGAINVNGRTLAHEAARWHSRKLLKTVYDDFGVSLRDAPDANGQTILFELLESGMPFNTFTLEGTWEAMEYLVDRGDLSRNRQVIAENSDGYLDFAAQIHDIPETYLKLLIYKHTPNAKRLELLDDLHNFIGFEDVDISPKIRSIRRKLIVKNSVNAVVMKKFPEAMVQMQSNIPNIVTVSEIVIAHADVLGYYNFDCYKRTVKLLLQREASIMGRMQIERVVTAIAKNTVYMAEIDEIKSLLRTDVQPFFQEPFVLDVSKIFLKRINHEIPQSTRGVKLETFVVETVYDWYPRVVYNRPGEVAGDLNDHLPTPDGGYESPNREDAIACNF